MLNSMCFVLLAGLAVRQGTCATPSNTSSDAPYQAPLHGHDHPTRIANTYLVALKSNYTIGQHWHAIGRDLSSSPNFIHYDQLFGYNAQMDADALALVRRDPNVDFVETDRHEMDAVPHFSGAVTSHNSSLHSHSKRQTVQYNTVTQPKAPWNLQMISARAKKFTVPIEDFTGSYTFLYQAGRGVNIYVLDTGIRLSHTLFQGRASNFGGLSPKTVSPYVSDGSTMADRIGHGTHVAGIAGAQTYGVAQGANLINVKCMNNQGGFTYSLVIKAINDVYAEHRKNYANKKGWDFRGSVMNMSWGRTGSAYYLHNALGWADYYGVGLVAAAGNSDTTSSNLYPCNARDVMCVASVDRNYKKSVFSNYGSAITFLAPGSDIWSLSNTDDTATEQMSGTSMASPHVAGAVAIFTSWRDLTTGGADSYVWWNSLSGLTSGWPWFLTSTQNDLVNTGIASPKKYKNEPFRWAKDDPYAVAGGGVVPLADISNTPLGVSSSASFLTLTTSGKNITESVPTAFPTGSGTGLLDTSLEKSGVVDTSVSGIPASTLPASIQSAIGLSITASTTSASATTCGVNKTCPPAPKGSTSRCMEVDGGSSAATCSYGPTPSTTSS